MSYATRADLESRFGFDEIAAIAGDDDAGTAKVNSALADAAAEINAVLASAYTLPLSGTYPLLTAVACDLARALLYDEERPDVVRNNASRARKKVDKIRGGGIDLVDSAGKAAERRISGAALTSQPQQFTSENLLNF